ncbi:15187_t:CDS:2 [Funneliformis caledonium]|uniref:15187_t:CDS:1 n=1 Tax=Funneliformis caledonium TaxID=1117310 RepID=A0A9N8ZBB0_9GLOM|nr:15187_t:CDS:2 [Funneliformis caledonium]
MNKLDKFMLDFVLKNSEINEFFTKTTLRWWNRVDLFIKFIYTVNPVITPQEVLNEYDQSLAKIINTKGIDSSTRESNEVGGENFQSPYSNVNNSPSRAVTPPLQHNSHSQSQRPQIPSPSDPSISPEFEKETDVYNSENDDDLERSDFDTSDHEETVEEEVVVKMTDNKKISVMRQLNCIYSKEERDEIDSAFGSQVPDILDEINEFLMEFLDKSTLKGIQKVIKETMFDDNYDHEKDHDKDYIIYVIYSLLREIENRSLKVANFEAWFNCHVWNPIFDQAFGDMNMISVVRQSEKWRKMGRRGDIILRLVGNGDRDEFGAREARKITQDMLVKLMAKTDWNEEKCAKIQTVGVIHAGTFSPCIRKKNQFFKLTYLINKFDDYDGIPGQPEGIHL